MRLPRLTWADRGRTRAALLDVPVVCLDAPDMTPAELLAFAMTLGEVPVQPRERFRLDGEPRLMVVGNVRDAQGVKRGASALKYGFHSDMSWGPNAPDLTLLYARTVPRQGGDTLFRSLHAVHDGFDEATLAAWAGLEVFHRSSSKDFEGQAGTSCVRPLVQTHADSGRPLLFASPAYTAHILGVSEERSTAILEQVNAVANVPDRTHRWAVNDLLIWDNRAVLHCATPHDPAEPRCLWRASVHVAKPPSGLARP